MKVFTSLLMQLGIAIIILLGLLWLNVRPLRSKSKNGHHVINLATALLDFHKAQCYFITAIEIATLVLAGQVHSAYDYNGDPDMFDIMLALPISLNGIVPVAFSLSCIALYTRLSWHIISLSVIPIALSSGALASVYMLSFNEPGFIRKGPLSNDFPSIDSSFVPQFTRIVCGSKSGNLEGVADLVSANFTVIWLIYAHSIAWAFWCVLMRVHHNGTKRSSRTRMLAGLERKLTLGRLSPVSRAKMVSYAYAFSLIIWGLCFTYHIYLYSLFARSKLVSSQWSFGQIIAVTVWIPSIIELLYLEHGTLQSPS